MPSKSVVITGASGGIGAALAEALGKRGHSVTLGARRADALGDVARRIGTNALAVVADVTRRDDVERLRDRAIGQWGRVDTWVSNAGMGIDRRVLQLTDADMDTVLRANLYSALYGMQAIVPYFIERGAGHLVNVSSMLARVPHATHRSVYSAAKAALNSLTTNLRDDLRLLAPALRVSLVMPGPVVTEFASHAIHAPADARPSRGPIASQSPEEVAEVMADLIEDRDPAAELFTSEALVAEARRHAGQNVGVGPRL